MCASKTIVYLALVLSLGLFLVLWRFYPRGPETNSFSVENPLPENDSVPVAAIFENILVSKTYRVVGLEDIPDNVMPRAKGENEERAQASRAKGEADDLQVGGGHGLFPILFRFFPLLVLESEKDVAWI